MPGFRRDLPARRLFAFCMLALTALLGSCGRATTAPQADPILPTPTAPRPPVATVPAEPSATMPTPEPAIVPRLTGQFAAAVFAVTPQDDYAYLGVGTRLVVLDVSDPTAPSELGRSVTLPDFIRDVVVSQGYAYLATGWGGLVVIDVSDPNRPLVVSQFQANAPMSGLALNEATAYLAAGEEGLLVVELSDPSAPSLVGALDTPGSATAVTVSESTVYLADGAGGAWVVDVTDPAHPVGSSLYELLDSSDPALLLDYSVSDSLHVHDVALQDGLLYAAVGREDTSPFNKGVRVFDVSDPSRPEVVGRYLDHELNSHVAVSGSQAYTANRSGSPTDAFSLNVLDISDVTDPSRAGGYSTDLEVSDLAADGMYLYVANGAKGLRIVDVSSAADPRVVGTYEPIRPIAGYAAAVQDSLAYLADGEFGLQVTDLSNPADPLALSVHDTPDFATDVLLSGTIALIADLEGGLRVLNVADPAHPVEIGRYESDSWIRRLALLDDVLYAVSSIGDLHVLSLTDPAAPEPVTIIRDTDIGEIQIVGEMAFYTRQFGDFQVADLSDRTQPTVIGELIEGWDARDVFVAGNYAYFAAEEIGSFLDESKPDGSLRVVDISDPEHPIEAGSFMLPRFASAVVASESYAFVGDVEGWVTMIDVTDPRMPHQLAAFQTPVFGISDLNLIDSSLIVSGFGGAVILHVGEVLQLAQISPGPSGPAPTPVKVIPTPVFIEPPAAAPEGEPFGELIGITQVSMMDAEVGWGLGGFDGDLYPRLLRTEDGGHRWREVTPPETQLSQLAESGDFTNARLEALDSERAWVIYRNVGRVWRTSDGGATWSASDPLPLEGTEEGDSFYDEYLAPLTLDFIDSQNGWLAVNEAQAMMHGDLELLRTADGGTTWQHIFHRSIFSYYGMVFLDERTGWISDGDVGFNAEALERTGDGGRSWEFVTGLPGVGSQSMFMACEALCPTPFLQVFRPRTVFITVFQSSYDLGFEQYNALYVSDDGGSTWEERPLPADGGHRSTSLIFADPKSGWLLDTHTGRLLGTSDGGQTWTELRQGNWGGRLNFISDRLGWAVAWYLERGEPYYTALEGRALLRTVDGGRTWEQLQPRLIP
jgi:photosystem II stability/assembly factor-like uncharacterized protein